MKNKSYRICRNIPSGWIYIWPQALWLPNLCPYPSPHWEYGTNARCVGFESSPMYAWRLLPPVKGPRLRHWCSVCQLFVAGQLKNDAGGTVAWLRHCRVILDLVRSSTVPSWVSKIFIRYLKQYIKRVILFELVILFGRFALLFEQIASLLFSSRVTHAEYESVNGFCKLVVYRCKKTLAEIKYYI